MRALVIVMDSFGIENAPDAEKFGDKGSNTLGHIAQYCQNGLADNQLRKGALKLPNLERLGLGHAYKLVNDNYPDGFNQSIQTDGYYGAATEVSSGKDTPSGHWEIAGVPMYQDWGYFSKKQHSFPEELLQLLVDKANLKGYLGNCYASGTEIIAQLGEAHIQSGKPIFYTSNDSVFQIAVHEQSFGLDNLYNLCEIAYDAIKPYNICRVIARPFIGHHKDEFKRTGNRRDYAVAPPKKTVLEKLTDAGGKVIAIGKISDIYAGCGISTSIKANGHDQLWQETLSAWHSSKENTLVMANFVEFDQSFGHRRDVSGYAQALEEFDQKLPHLLDQIQHNDLLIIVADHGCDPTWHGNDHTREYVPVLIYGKNLEDTIQNDISNDKSLGIRSSFADIGQSLAKWFDLKEFNDGESFIKKRGSYESR